MHRRLSSLVFASLLLAGPASSAVAQQPSATLDRFAPGETVEDDFHLSRARDFGHLRFGAQLHLDYGFNPLVYENTLGATDSELLRVVEHELVGTVGLSFGLFDRLTIFAGLPVVLWMDGSTPAELAPLNVAPADASGLGDTYLGARVRLLGDADDIGALALQVTATFPTGAYETQSYRSEDFVTLHPEVIAELRPGAGTRFVLNVGARIRDEDPVGLTNIEFRHALTFGLGFAVPVWTDEANSATHLDAHVQVYGSTAFAYAFEREHTPAEATAGFKLFHASGVVTGLAGGLGVARGFGSPDVRLIAMVGYAMPTEASVEAVDSDGDGLVDADDQCPEQPEDTDGFQDDDGCPDPDNDADGILDVEDECIDEPETMNGLEDEDGCPDEAPGDRDQDGLTDDVDECPDDPEDRDEFEDDNGCPDPDNDQDGILDEPDQCPNEAEVVNGVDDEDGCPDESVIEVTCDAIVIHDRIYFESNRDVIQERSFELLNQMGAVFGARADILRVSIEGHTDSRGSDSHNLELSTRRAAAVVAYLTQHGVAQSRLTSTGHGETLPIDSNRTRDGRANNRRVEFRILEQEGCQDEPTPAVP